MAKPRAFTNVDTIGTLADDLAAFGDVGRAAAKAAVDEVAREVRDVQRREVPKDSWETHDSIRVNRSDDGLEASVGPTNVDNKGRPVGFFIEYGARGIDPAPFVRPSAKVAQKRLPERLGEHLERLSSL